MGQSAEYKEFREYKEFMEYIESVANVAHASNNCLEIERQVVTLEEIKKIRADQEQAKRE